MTKPPNANPDYDTRTISRARAAIIGGQEVRDAEFKRSETFDTLKKAIVRASMGISNLRDGGILVIGYDESCKNYQEQGISADDLDSFDIDGILSLINKYADPPLSPKICTVNVENKEFLVLDFDMAPAPVVAKKAHDDWGISVADIFYRPAGMPETRKPRSAAEIRDLLEPFIEMGAAKLVDTINRVAPNRTAPNDPKADRDAAAFDDELGDL